MASIPVRARAQPPRQPPTTAVTRRKRLGLAVGALSQLYAFVLERVLECLWEDTCVELGGGACEETRDEVWRHAWTRVTRRSCWDDGGEPVVTLYGTFKLQKKAPPAPLVVVATGYRHAVVALAARLDSAPGPRSHMNI